MFELPWKQRSANSDGRHQDRPPIGGEYTNGFAKHNTKAVGNIMTLVG